MVAKMYRFTASITRLTLIYILLYLLLEESNLVIDLNRANETFQ